MLVSRRKVISVTVHSVSLPVGSSSCLPVSVVVVTVHLTFAVGFNLRLLSSSKYIHSFPSVYIY